MPETTPARRYRFGIYEADAAAGELLRQGRLVRLNAQPFQLLVYLLGRAGEVVTREEICRELWPGDTFVDYEHGVNSAVNRIREALGDSAANPRFVQTLARRGYRFIAPVQALGPQVDEEPGLAEVAPATVQEAAPTTVTLLSRAEELPPVRWGVVQTIYVCFQLMYVGFYIGALGNLGEIEELMQPLPYATEVFYFLIVTAALLIPVRTFQVTAVVFHPPGVRQKLLVVWRWLLPFELAWALAPFLLLHHMEFGIALGCTGLLVYSPFAQRALVLMGAGERRPKGI